MTIVPAARPRQAIDHKKGFLACKRLVDILFSILFILCVMSWLVPLLGFLILATSGGPVFFTQRRVGRYGRSFRCIKFRTMVRNPEADSRQCAEDDERVTRLGKFLRITNIDEFPQFFNILAGSMSLVGPRPHMHEDCKRFSAILTGYKMRNLVRPGLTGLAQTKGYYGRTMSQDSIWFRFYWDRHYIHNLNWRMDCRIFLLTVTQRIHTIARLLFTCLFRLINRQSTSPKPHV